jgi:hypothetical protein
VTEAALGVPEGLSEVGGIWDQGLLQAPVVILLLLIAAVSSFFSPQPSIAAIPRNPPTTPRSSSGGDAGFHPLPGPTPACHQCFSSALPRDDRCGRWISADPTRYQQGLYVTAAMLTLQAPLRARGVAAEGVSSS